MARWDADREAIAARHPDERWRGECSRAVAAELQRYDHHTVWRDGRRALLLTLHWLDRPLEEQAEPLELLLSFTYAKGHPAAPPPIQALVDAMTLTPLPTVEP